MILADLIYQPCAGVEYESWLWWLKGCFLYQTQTAVLFGVGMAALVGVGLWLHRRQA